MVLDFTAIVAVITGIVEVIKRAFNLDTKYCPVIALGLGIGANLLLNTLGGNLGENIVWGAVMGLTASGLYDNVVKGGEVLKG